MDIDKILASGLINLSKLAELLYGDNKTSQPKLWRKINNKNGQRLTEKDRENIKKILEKLF